MNNYDTVSETLSALKLRGFEKDLVLLFDGVQCNSSGRLLTVEDFEIVEHYRFEGDTDPGDESIVYAIQSKDGTIKGTLVSAYGTYSEAMSESLIQKLSVNE